MNKKNLEEKLREKVTILLEEAMNKSWGISIPKVESDITDLLQNPLPLKLYVPTGRFHDAKLKFKTEFLKSQLRLHKGNISQSAKFLGMDRRSIHRAVKDLDIMVGPLKKESLEMEEYAEHLVHQTIRSALEEYKEIIQPQKMEKIYQEVPALSRNIAKFFSFAQLTWKQAELEFERQFLSEALKDNRWKIIETAQKIGLRPETLHRKIKKLGLKK